MVGYWGDDEIADLLLVAGADVSAKDQKGRTTLHLAVVTDNNSTSEILLTAGEDVSLLNEDERTALTRSNGIGSWQDS
jgi:ankyrin repeat protein